ncbi:hypothetical protein [Streptomyces altiplanensis]
MTIRFRTAAFAAAAATGALLLTACSTTDTAPAQGKVGATSDADPGTGHLHGLGLDPADGALYAAGHLGVFRLTPPAPYGSPTATRTRWASPSPARAPSSPAATPHPPTPPRPHRIWA